MELLLLGIIGIPACYLLYFVLMFIPGISKLPTKAIIAISVIICLTFAIILYSGLMTPAGGSDLIVAIVVARTPKLFLQSEDKICAIRVTNCIIRGIESANIALQDVYTNHLRFQHHPPTQFSKIPQKISKKVFHFPRNMLSSYQAKAERKNTKQKSF